jgi:hypothetical protein
VEMIPEAIEAPSAASPEETALLGVNRSVMEDAGDANTGLCAGDEVKGAMDANGVKDSETVKFGKACFNKQYLDIFLMITDIILSSSKKEMDFSQMDFSRSIKGIEENPMFVGLASMVIFMTAKFLLHDVHKCIGSSLDHSVAKVCGFFAIIFINTRSIKVSVIFAAIYLVLREFVFHKTLFADTADEHLMVL